MKVYVILSGEYQYAGVRLTLEQANEYKDDLTKEFGDIFYIEEEEI